MVKPEFERAAQIAANLSLPLSLAAVNADAHAVFAGGLGVSKFPTLFLFKAGAPQPFPVLTVGEAFVAGAARMLGLPGADALSPVRVFPADAEGPSAAADVAAWLFWRGGVEGAIATTVVLYDPPGLAGEAAAEAAGLSRAFYAAAGELFKNPNVRFATASAPAVLDAFDIPAAAASVVLYKEADEGRVVFPLPPRGRNRVTDAKALAEWVGAHLVPLVTVVDHRNLERYRARVRRLALFFVDAPQWEHRATSTRLRAELLAAVAPLVAEGLVERGDFTVGLVDGKKYGQWLEHYGYNATLSGFPALALEDTATQSYFLMPARDLVPAGACAPPASAAAPPPPARGTDEYRALPNGYDTTAPYMEADGRPMHTGPWCAGGGSWAAARAAASATEAVAINAEGAAARARPAPGVVPSFAEGFSHDPLTVAARERAARGGVAGSVATPDGFDEVSGEALDKLFPPLFWVSAPRVGVNSWLHAVVVGAVAPVRPAGNPLGEPPARARVPDAERFGGVPAPLDEAALAAMPPVDAADARLAAATNAEEYARAHDALLAAKGLDRASLLRESRKATRRAAREAAAAAAGGAAGAAGAAAAEDVEDDHDDDDPAAHFAHHGHLPSAHAGPPLIGPDGRPRPLLPHEHHHKHEAAFTRDGRQDAAAFAQAHHAHTTKRHDVPTEPREGVMLA